MSIESMMYFALGALAAALVMLAIMPAIWRRAVRLTRKRIEAATPVTLAEFRADKDQLRAGFAVATRRLETQVDQLRARLAAEMDGASRGQFDLAQLEEERARHRKAAADFEAQEAALKSQLAALEVDHAALARRLDERDHELVEASRELGILREAMQQRRLSAAGAADDEPREGSGLAEAEGRIASAGSRLDALLEETVAADASAAPRSGQLLAEKLTLEGDLEQLREKVAGVEAAVAADWDSERAGAAHLRERLSDIASEASRLVFAAPARGAPDAEESLFDRVQRYADDGVRREDLPVRPGPPGEGAGRDRPSRPGGRSAGGGSVSDRMAALRELQGRH